MDEFQGAPRLVFGWIPGAPGGQPACRVSLAFAIPWLLTAKRIVTMLGAPRIPLSRWHVDEILFSDLTVCAAGVIGAAWPCMLLFWKRFARL